MKREFFEGYGLTKEQLDAIMAENGKDIEAALAKSKLLEQEATAKKTEAEKQLAEIEVLRTSAKDADTLKAELERLKTESTTRQTALEQQLTTLRVQSAVKLDLAGKVTDAQFVDYLAGLVDASKVQLGDDGGIKGGYTDQLEGLQKSKSAFFKPDAPPPAQGAQVSGATLAQGAVNSAVGADTGAGASGLAGAVASFYGR